MPGRLFITPRDSAPCIPRPLSLPEGPASRSATPNASNTTAGLRRRLHGQTHDKRAAHQTRYALDTAATVSSLLRHRDRTKSQKNSSLVPSQAPRLLKTRKNDSLAPSQAPRPRKIPEKQQSRPLSGTETAQNPRKTTVSSLLKHRDRAKPRKNHSLVPSQAPRPHTTEGRGGWDSYYVLQGRGGKRGERWGWAASQGRGGEEGKTRGRGQNGRLRTQEEGNSTVRMQNRRLHARGSRMRLLPSLVAGPELGKYSFGLWGNSRHLSIHSIRR